MSVLIELLVYLAVELVGDLLLESTARGAVRVARSRTGRFTVSALVGLAVGLAWGHHLTGSTSWPRLLWVSLAAAVAALLLAAGRAGATGPPASPTASPWRGALVPPWMWSSERLVALAILNVGMAIGILATFRPAAV